MSLLVLSADNKAIAGKCSIAVDSISPFGPSNLLDPSFATFNRAVSRTPVYSIQYFETVSLGLIGLAKTNLSAYATWRIRLYTDSSKVTLVYDSGIIPCFTVFSGIGQLSWGEFSWGAGFKSFSSEEPRIKNCFHYMGGNYSGRFLEIEVFDSDSNLENYIQKAVIWTAKAYSVSEGALYGSATFSRDRIISKEMESGARVYSEPSIIRGIRLDLELSKSTLLSGLLGSIYLSLGKKADIVAYLEPDSPEYQQFQCIIGNLEELQEVEQPYWQRIRTTLTVLEKV